MTANDDIRREVRKIRRALSRTRVIEMSLRICGSVMTLPEYVRAEKVMCYASLPEEVETGSLLRAIRGSGRELFLPRTHRDGRMDAVRVTDDTAFETDRMGIMVPASGAELPPGKLDLVLVPGIAFDRTGNRIGFGRGYYDRFLAKCVCPAVGLAFEAQLVDGIRPQVHDVPMHRIVTEKTVYICREITE